MDDIATVMDQDAARERAATPDKLNALRECAKKLRDVELEIQMLQERLADANKRKSNIEFSELPQLMINCGMTSMTLEAQGNHPAQIINVADYYKANIAADWDEERREAGFAWLERHQMGDAVKAEITVSLGLGEGKKLNKVLAALKKLKVQCSVSRSIPWNTLTAYVRERYERGRPLGDDDLRTIGATVSKIAKIRPVKLKKES